MSANASPKAPTERVLLWLDDCRGQYIPQHFAQSFKNRHAIVDGVSEQDWCVLDTGPDHEHYWDTWNDVEANAKVYLDGKESDHFWSIYNDGGCFLVRDDVEWCGECYGWKDAACGCTHTDTDANELDGSHSVSAHERYGDNH